MSAGRLLLAGAALLGALAGCAQPGGTAAAPDPGRLGAGQVAGLGVGAAAGAIVGGKLGGDTGAFVGGAAGLAGAAWIENGPSTAPERAAAEAARRDERQKIMRQYWAEQTEAWPADLAAGAAAGVPLEYPAGAYAGVNFGPRLTADPSLTEPNR